jgi:broad specificity phosphatase PhoE
MTTIYFVRHGQTDYNFERCLYGSTDVPINTTGEAQAESAALKLKEIKFDKIYCSTMKRAQQTCAIINQFHNLEIISNKDIVERAYGEYEGVLESSIPNIQK